MSKKDQNKIGWWMVGVLLVAAAVAGYFVWGYSSGPNPSILNGKWQRSDGSYVLELNDAGPNGQLKAAYFNPRPINVSHSSWKVHNDALQAFVELSDVNYPGSTYTLNYDPATDRLEGHYFQAVQKQNFKVLFTRTK